MVFRRVAFSWYTQIIALIISGVPQGTALGPILFLILINDIYLCIKHSTIICIADDTRLLKAICNKAIVTTLQSDLDSVIKWYVTNKMTLHEDKFEFICHRSTKSNMLYELPTVCQFFQYTTSNGSTLNPVKTVRDLGITVSEDFSWAPHINMICDKARQILAWVFSVFHTRSTEVMLTLFKSLVRSILEFTIMESFQGCRNPGIRMRPANLHIKNRWSTASPILGPPKETLPYVPPASPREIHNTSHVENTE